MRRVATIMLGIATGAAFASATDVPLLGLRMLVKDTATSKKAVYLSKDSPIAIPVSGGTNDPTVFGGTFRVINPGTHETAAMDLPAANWEVNPTHTVYRFFNRDAPGGPSPVRTAILKNTVLKVKANAAGLTLDENFQATIVGQLDIGDTSWCSAFFWVAKDDMGLFLARRQPSKASACQSPSGAFLDLP